MSDNKRGWQEMQDGLKAWRMALRDGISYSALMLAMPYFDYKPLRAEISAALAAMNERTKKLNVRVGS